MSDTAIENSRSRLTFTAPICVTRGVFPPSLPAAVPALPGTLHNYTIIFPSPASLCLTDIAGEIQIQTRQ